MIYFLPGLTVLVYLGVNISRANNLSKVLDETCQKTRKAQRVIDMYIVNHPTVSLDHI